MNDSENGAAYIIKSPMKGRVCRIEDVPDPAFSKKLIGEGVAIIPEEPFVYTPVDGKIVSVFEMRHALVFENIHGIRVLVHVGIGTMRLKGEGFKAHVENGQDVKKSDRLLTFNLEYIERHALGLASPVIVTSPRNCFCVRILAEDEVEVGDPLFEIQIFEAQ